MTRTVLALLLVVSLAGGLMAQSAPELYQQALVHEHTHGDLERAIAVYAQVVRTAAGNRALAARAWLRMAGAQEKLGKATEASASYGSLVREYPDQRTEAAVAQERLAALRRTAPGSVGPGGTVAGDVSAVVRPAIDRYCSSCHNSRVRTAGLDLDAAVRQPIAGNTALWEQVARRLKARRDPPAGVSRPDGAGYRTLVSTIERALDTHYAAERASLPFERASDAVLAARLATWLWSGPPDAPLLAAAARGELRGATMLRPQIVRMLRDPRSSALVDGFFTQWLSLDRLRAAGTSAPLKADADLLQSMQTETRLFLIEQLRDDRDAAELWTASYTYVNERLARHYGLGGTHGPEFRRVALPDAQRRGLLGQAGPLTMLAINGRTSPTVRGIYVLTRFLGLDAPPPPANVPPLAEEPAGQLGTMRDRITMHKTNPSCASCHSIFDPLGLALENFDATGAWRTTDGGTRIDASGIFADGTAFDGPAGLRARLLVHRDAYYTGVTRQLLATALNRQGASGRVYDFEMADVRAALREAAGHDYRWSAILAGVAASAPFQMKEVVP